MSRAQFSLMALLALAALLLTLGAMPFGCARKADAPQPASQPAGQSAQQQPPGQATTSGPAANFGGNWLCVYGKDRIPGALTQRGSQLTGHCIYPGNKRATFSGTVSGNALSGTLDVPHQKNRWRIQATLNGNAMSGTWQGSNKWTATRR